MYSCMLLSEIVGSVFFVFFEVTQQATIQGLAPHPDSLDPPTSQHAKESVQE